MGDADATKSTGLGLKNLERVMNMLLAATSTQKGEPYDDLEEVYARVLGQWTLEMNHVANIIGGFNTQQKNIGQDGILFTPLSRQRQAGAVKFLNENAFATPQLFMRPEILRRIEPVGVLERVRSAQRSVLNNALNTARFARLVEQDAMEPGSSYAPADFLADVRRGVWKELEGASPVKLDAYRRNLQRAYLEIFNDRINRPATAPSMPGIPGFTPPPTTEYVRPFFRSELRALNASVAAAISRTADRATRAHLEDVKDQIAKILDPKFALPTAQLATGTAGRGLEPDGTPAPTCWPDYKIIR